MAGHSRPKDGVALLAYDPAIHPLRERVLDRRVKPGDDGREWSLAEANNPLKNKLIPAPPTAFIISAASLIEGVVDRDV
jgi:hypothetical protein